MEDSFLTMGKYHYSKFFFLLKNLTTMLRRGRSREEESTRMAVSLGRRKIPSEYGR